MLVGDVVGDGDGNLVAQGKALQVGVAWIDQQLGARKRRPNGQTRKVGDRQDRAIIHVRRARQQVKRQRRGVFGGGGGQRRRNGRGIVAAGDGDRRGGRRGVAAAGHFVGKALRGCFAQRQVVERAIGVKAEAAVRIEHQQPLPHTAKQRKDRAGGRGIVAGHAVEKGSVLVHRKAVVDGSDTAGPARIAGVDQHAVDEKLQRLDAADQQVQAFQSDETARRAGAFDRIKPGHQLGLQGGIGPLRRRQVQPQRIEATPAIVNIGQPSLAAGERVDQGIIAGAGQNQIVAIAAIDRIVAGARNDDVAATAAKDEIIATPCQEYLGPVGAIDDIVAPIEETKEIRNVARHEIPLLKKSFSTDARPIPQTCRKGSCV